MHGGYTNCYCVRFCVLRFSVSTTRDASAVSAASAASAAAYSAKECERGMRSNEV